MIPFFVSGTLLLMMFVFYIALMMVVQKNQQIKLMKQHEYTLLLCTREAHEQTLKSISTELHDNIVQKLRLMRHQYGTIRNRSTDAKQQEAIYSNISILESVINEVSHIYESIKGDFFAEIGIDYLLEQEVNNLNASACIKARYHQDGYPPPLQKSQVMHLFRIAQESLQNTLKHAAANKIDIHLVIEQNMLRMILVDDGRGFDRYGIYNPLQAGSGLKNMKERAEKLSGNLEVISKRGNGTTIHFTMQLPLAEIAY